MLSLARAAQAAGKSKPTLLRAIKSASFPPAAPRAAPTRSIPRSWRVCSLDSEVDERRRLLALLTGPKLPWWRKWFR